MKNRHREVLDRLGGYQRVADLLGMDHPETVRSWHKRGIPPRYWHRIAALDPEATPAWLEAAAPRSSRSRREAAE